MRVTRPRLAWQVFAVSGVAFLAGALVLIVVGAHGSGAQDVSMGSLPSPSPTCTTAAVLLTTPCVADRVADGQVVVPVHVLADVTASTAAPVPAPVSLAIPSIGVEARVVPTGIRPDGVVVIPTDISTVGWVDSGPAPGSDAGSSVIVGHRDGRLAGDGALYDLARLSPGDEAIVTNAVGHQLRYRVVAREVISKAQFALRSGLYFSATGAPRLTMITCGGVYDSAAGGYQSNVIVTATPDVG